MAERLVAYCADKECRCDDQRGIIVQEITEGEAVDITLVPTGYEYRVETYNPTPPDVRRRASPSRLTPRKR